MSPPPPPGCFPFSRSRSSRDGESSGHTHSRTSLSRSHTVSSTSTLTSKAEKLTFSSDSVSWDNIPIDVTTRSPGKFSGSRSPSGTRSPSGVRSPSGTRSPHGVHSPSGTRSPPGENVLTPVTSRTPSWSSTKSKGILSVLHLSRNNSSSSTLVGSAYERKVNDALIPPLPKVDTTSRLEELRKLMTKERIDY